MKLTRRSALLSLPVLTGLAACSKVSEGGEGFPEGDIRLIIQADPGGGSDLSSRALAKQLEESLGVSVIPENKPGASGAIAMEYVGKQKPDGYTLGFCPVEISMLHTTQNADLLPENFTFIGQIMNAPGVISVAADSEYEALEDLLTAAEKEELTVGNSGAGSIWEAATLGINAELGTIFTPVPYDGGATAVSAAASGEAAAAVSGAGEALAQGEEVRVLGVMHEEALPDLPNVPTFKDAVGADLQYGGWGGIYTAADLPDDIRDTLEKAVKDAVDSDAYQEFQKKSGNLVVYRDSEEFSQFVQEQYDEFATLLG